MTQTSSQGTSSERVLFDGFRPQIHPPVITAARHCMQSSSQRRNSVVFSKAVYSFNTNLLAPRYVGTYYATTPDRLVFYSGFRCTLVRPFLLHSAVVKLTQSI
jgi:hypothetical protein